MFPFPSTLILGRKQPHAAAPQDTVLRGHLGGSRPGGKPFIGGWGHCSALQEEGPTGGRREACSRRRGRGWPGRSPKGQGLPGLTETSRVAGVEPAEKPGIAKWPRRGRAGSAIPGGCALAGSRDHPRQGGSEPGRRCWRGKVRRAGSRRVGLPALWRAPQSWCLPSVCLSMHACISCSESPCSLLGEPAPDTLSPVAPGGDRAAEAGSPRPAFSQRHLLSPRVTGWLCLVHRLLPWGSTAPWACRPQTQPPPPLPQGSVWGYRFSKACRGDIRGGPGRLGGEIRQPASSASSPTHVLILWSAGFRCTYPSTSASGRIAFVFLGLLTDPPADLWPSLQLRRSAVWNWSWGLR